MPLTARYELATWASGRTGQAGAFCRMRVIGGGIGGAGTAGPARGRALRSAAQAPPGRLKPTGVGGRGGHGDHPGTAPRG
ncbi:MAG: hypothetical protein AVDCRST_MAG49-1107 [uncultured Thermomicrobiales bacterium]|uniref:Uncharacterized protein n=1 Tax=uncultured Thermomicrobiales bacterium TaxID=1645740 RepID=A0A6J4U905_9BACT|nr:MAG: hypothetical protein AVDCRST_MAG49-1107 [uncultured Thermomicrobiales bacterium]